MAGRGVPIDWEEVRANYNRKYKTGFLLLRDVIAHAYRNRAMPEAAERLGVGYNTCARKIRELGLQRGKKHRLKVKQAVEYFRRNGLDEGTAVVAQKLGFSDAPVRSARKEFPGEETIKFDPWPGVCRWHNWKHGTTYRTPEEMISDLYAKHNSHAELAHRLQQNKKTIADKLKEVGLGKQRPGRPMEARR